MSALAVAGQSHKGLLGFNLAETRTVSYTEGRVEVQSDAAGKEMSGEETFERVFASL